MFMRMAAALRLAVPLVFWGGLHHNVKTVTQSFTAVEVEFQYEKRKPSN